MLAVSICGRTLSRMTREAACARARWTRWRGARLARLADARLQAAARADRPFAEVRGDASGASGPLGAPRCKLEQLATRELAALAGAEGRGAVERRELESLARKKLSTRAALEKVLGSRDLYGGVLVFVDTADMNALAATSRECREAACEDLLWRPRALRMLGKQFIPRVTLEVTRDRVLVALQKAHALGFFRGASRNAIGEPSSVPCSHAWRSLLSDCRRLKSQRADGFGGAVVVPRAEICPHHVLGVVHLLSIRKDPVCAADIFERFLTLYASLDGDLRLRDNVGFCFRAPLDPGSVRAGSGTLESVSHKDFMDVVLEANLQLKDLISYHQATQPASKTVPAAAQHM